VAIVENRFSLKTAIRRFTAISLARKVEVWAYCLMPNHLHLILNPQQANGLGRAVGEAHRRYTNFINARGRWTGHLFQSRFASVAMNEWHLLSAVCYVRLNPVGTAGDTGRELALVEPIRPV
jgi:REP element-mobilizing transposase RayT